MNLFLMVWAIIWMVIGLTECKAWTEGIALERRYFAERPNFRLVSQVYYSPRTRLIIGLIQIVVGFLFLGNARFGWWI